MFTPKAAHRQTTVNDGGNSSNRENWAGTVHPVLAYFCTKLLTDFEKKGSLEFVIVGSIF